MNSKVSFFPEQASTFAGEVDQLFWFYMAVCGLAGLVTLAVAVTFAVRYRADAKRHAHTSHHNTPLEIGWTLPVAVVVIALFAWGAKLFVAAYTPPKQPDIEIYVTGKQWMWKMQHPNGKREINELHVPMGETVLLTLTSEDVIHSFFIPVFRTKKDAVPGRYTRMWFEATKLGSYHIFCAEYCGTDHSRMIGTVHVMRPEEYQAWLNEASGKAVSMIEKGEQIYNRHACATCHDDASQRRGPDLQGIFGSERELVGGTKVVADESYLRESIIKPNAKMVQGYAPVMPTFKGVMSDEDINSLIAFLKARPAPPAKKEQAALGGGEQ